MRTFTAAAAVVLGISLVSFSLSSVNAAPDGKALYEKRCGTCHGIDDDKGNGGGKGKESVAKIKEIDVARMDLTAERNIKKSDEELVKVVREGKDKMLGIPSSRLSDDDLTTILVYIRTLQKK